MTTFGQIRNLHPIFLLPVFLHSTKLHPTNFTPYKIYTLSNLHHTKVTLLQSYTLLILHNQFLHPTKFTLHRFRGSMRGYLHAVFSIELGLGVCGVVLHLHKVSTQPKLVPLNVKLAPAPTSAIPMPTDVNLAPAPFQSQLVILAPAQFPRHSSANSAPFQPHLGQSHPALLQRHSSANL